MSKKMTARETLNEVYLTVVREWALYAGEIAEATGLSAKEVNANLQKLKRAGLVDGTHVNGERQTMWQSYYNTQDYDMDEELAKAQREFDEAFPNDPATEAEARKAATGPRYTPEQLQEAIRLRATGSTWKATAAAVGVKSPGHFAKVVTAYAEEQEKVVAKRGRKSARVAKRVVKRVKAADG